MPATTTMMTTTAPLPQFDEMTASSSSSPTTAVSGASPVEMWRENNQPMQVIIPLEINF